MRGTIYLHNAAGRALRQRGGAVHLRDVVHCMGTFAPGEEMHVGFRGADGGQFVIAMAVATCASAALVAWLEQPREETAGTLVVRAEDLRLLWPADGSAGAR